MERLQTEGEWEEARSPADTDGGPTDQEWLAEVNTAVPDPDGRPDPVATGSDVLAPGAEGPTATAEESGTDRASSAETANPKQERARANGIVLERDVLANVYHDPVRHTVTLLLDERHATAVIYAVRAMAADFEAHAREVRAVAATLPSWSYGHENRMLIAIRHERIASRLRRVESNYRLEVSGGRSAD